MRVVAVRVERGAVFVEFIRVDFAVMVGEREHFVAGEFDSARLMHVHMSVVAATTPAYGGVMASMTTWLV